MHFFHSSDLTIASTQSAYPKRDGQAKMAWVSWLKLRQHTHK